MKFGRSNKLSQEDRKRTLHNKLSFAAAEAYKLLRTNLVYTLPGNKKCKVVGVTSSTRSEGKSTTSINLSYSLAETGKKVLLIDADMRLPSIAKKMGLKGSPGLSNILVGTGAEQIPIFKTGVLDNWFWLPAGDIPPNPSELIGSQYMKELLGALSEKFDFIILDLPPVSPISDVLAVSPYLDGVLIVVREDYTNRKDLNYTIRQLKLSGSKILGFVMTYTKEEKKNYHRYKKYGGSYYSSYYKKPSNEK